VVVIGDLKSSGFRVFGNAAALPCCFLSTFVKSINKFEIKVQDSKMLLLFVPGLEVSSGDRGYDNGHRGIWLERGSDNLIVNFNITTRMYHDLSVSYYEQNTAFVNGTGQVGTRNSY
jgi:hypothetical protein